MIHPNLLRSALAAGLIFAAMPAASAGSINSTNNSMPNRISMNCTTPSGKVVTDPAVCANGGCVDQRGKPVTDALACAAPSSSGTPATDPAPTPEDAQKITRSRSNIQNN